MYYEFVDLNDNCIAEHESRKELISEVKTYYKGLAIDRENDEWEIEGKINLLDHNQGVVSTENYYAAGQLPSRRNVSPYLQAEFV